MPGCERPRSRRTGTNGRAPSHQAAKSSGMLVGMVLRVIMAVTLLVVGVVWILQGLDVLGGYGMSGHIEWTVIGAILVAVAVGLLVGARRDLDGPA